MYELVSIFLIGVSLSMDTFSLSLSIAAITKDSKLFKIFPILVGIFHFFLPLLGNIIGIKIISILNFASNIILGTILIILGINLLLNYFKDEKVNIKFDLLNIILLAISVSIDSFTVGLGLNDITTNNLLSSFVFAFLSFSFTYIGLIVGKYSNNIIGKYATILGIIMLLTIGIIHLL